MTWIDITLLLILAVAFPITGRRTYLQFLDRVAEGPLMARIAIYRWTIGLEYILLAAVILAWSYRGRPLMELGFGMEGGWRLVTAVAVVLAAVAMLLFQARQIAAGKTETVAGFRRSIEGLEEFVPHERAAFRWWIALSITAGICEEVIYRGYLMGIFADLGGPWLAVPASSIVFGLAHSYQGLRGMARVTLVGLFMAGFYLLTGSLWAPITVHVIGDVANGWMAYRVFGRRETPGAATAVPTASLR